MSSIYTFIHIGITIYCRKQIPYCTVLYSISPPGTLPILYLDSYIISFRITHKKVFFYVCWGHLTMKENVVRNRDSGVTQSLSNREIEESIPPGWESIPGLLERFTNTVSVQHVYNTYFTVRYTSISCI
jgi:hypothetical protein